MDAEIRVRQEALKRALEELKHLEEGTGFWKDDSSLVYYSSGKTTEQINRVYSTLRKMELEVVDLIAKTGVAINFALKKFYEADHAGEFEKIGNSLGGQYIGAKGISIGGVYIGADGNAYKGEFHQVSLVGQTRNYTCGSASGSMILNSIGVHVSEDDFWNYANAGGMGTYVYRVTQTLNHFIGSDKYKYVQTSSMGIDEYAALMSNSIKNGYPVEVVASIPTSSAFGYGTSGHYFVVDGVYKSESGEYRAKVSDPFSGGWYSNGHQGQQIDVKLSDIKQYNQNHSSYVICNCD